MAATVGSASGPGSGPPPGHRGPPSRGGCAAWSLVREFVVRVPKGSCGLLLRLPRGERSGGESGPLVESVAVEGVHGVNERLGLLGQSTSKGGDGSGFAGSGLEGVHGGRVRIGFPKGRGRRCSVGEGRVLIAVAIRFLEAFVLGLERFGPGVGLVEALLPFLTKSKRSPRECE